MDSALWPKWTRLATQYRPTRTHSCVGNGGLGSAFIVFDVDAPARARRDVVGIEAAHHAAVEGRADGPSARVRHAGEVDVVGVRHEARDGAGSEQKDPAANEMDVFIDPTVWRQTDVVALLEHAFQHRH